MGRSSSFFFSSIINPGQLNRRQDIIFRNLKQPKLLVKTGASVVLCTFMEEKLKIKNHFENTGPYI